MLDAPDPATRDGIRDRAMLHLAVCAGLRVSELTGLKLEDIDLSSMSISVLGKGRRERTLPLWKTTAAALRAWLAVRGRVAAPRGVRQRPGRAAEPMGLRLSAQTACSDRRSSASRPRQETHLAPRAQAHMHDDSSGARVSIGRRSHDLGLPRRHESAADNEGVVVLHYGVVLSDGVVGRASELLAEGSATEALTQTSLAIQICPLEPRGLWRADSRNRPIAALQDRPYERAGSASKRSSAEGVDCAAQLAFSRPSWTAALRQSTKSLRSGPLRGGREPRGG